MKNLSSISRIGSDNDLLLQTACLRLGGARQRSPLEDGRPLQALAVHLRCRVSRVPARASKIGMGCYCIAKFRPSTTRVLSDRTEPYRAVFIYGPVAPRRMISLPLTCCPLLSPLTRERTPL
jgi:hypothetical protein